MAQEDSKSDGAGFMKRKEGNGSLWARVGCTIGRPDEGQIVMKKFHVIARSLQ